MEEDIIEYEVHRQRDLEIEKRIISLLDAIYDEDHIEWDKICYYIPTPPMRDSIIVREVLTGTTEHQQEHPVQNITSPQDLAYSIAFNEDINFKKELAYWLAFYEVRGNKNAINT